MIPLPHHCSPEERSAGGVVGGRVYRVGSRYYKFLKKSICMLVYPVKFGLPKYAGVEGILFVDAEGHQLFFPSVSFFSFKFNLDMREEMKTWRRPFMYWTSNLHIRAEGRRRILELICKYAFGYRRTQAPLPRLSLPPADPCHRTGNVFRSL